MEKPSPALLAANQILRQKRAALAQARGAAGGVTPPLDDGGASPPPDLDTVCRQLPEHLGWGSDRVTAVLRARQERLAQERERAEAEAGTWLQDLAGAAQPDPAAAEATAPAERPETIDAGGHVRVYPDVALGMLRQNQAAAGRVWLLLQYIDEDGRGWISLERARRLLTERSSPLQIVGWRQLRNLLRAGQGVFWHRDEERIWLRSQAKTAVALEVAKLTGRPVAMPVTALCQSMGTVNAHLFASFHSGRKHNTPISRDALEQISGVPARTQLEYERITGVEKQQNIAIGARYSEEEIEKRAWIHGRTVFDFIDHLGFQGEAKRHYVAWWLPNSYRGCHRQCGKGRQRKINRQIDLVIKGRGNDPALHPKVFHANGAEAAKAYDGRLDQFWANDSGPRDEKMLWYTLAGWGSK